MTHRGLGVIIGVLVKGRGCDSKGIKRGKTRNGRVSKNVAGKQTGAKMNLCEIQKQVMNFFKMWNIIMELLFKMLKIKITATGERSDKQHVLKEITLHENIKSSPPL